MNVLQFVTDLNDKYAPVLAASQENATFDVGELVVTPKGSAVHMFDVNFERTSYGAGPGVRFEVTNTTAYCGLRSAATKEALDVALQNGPVVNVASPQANASHVQSSGKSAASSWLIGVVASAGVHVFPACVAC